MVFVTPFGQPTKFEAILLYASLITPLILFSFIGALGILG